MKVNKINWAGLMVEDFDAGVKFFLDVLKLPLENLYEDKQVAQFRLPSGQLFEVFGPKNKDRKEKYKLFNGVALGFEVDNFNEMQKKMSDEGVKFVTDVESSTNDNWAMFLGPEKRLFQIQEPSKKPLKNITYVCLYTSDLAESVKFYRDVLGFEPADPKEDSETSSWYSFKTGQTILALEKHGVKKDGLKTKSENPFLLQLTVETSQELEEMNQHLEKHGVKLLDRSKQTSYGLITNFCDPDGNKLEIICQIST